MVKINSNNTKPAPKFFGPQDTAYTHHVTRALINRVASLYKNNHEGADSSMQATNLYHHAIREAGFKTVEPINFEKECQLSVFDSITFPHPTDRYQEFVAKQIAAPLHTLSSTSHLFDASYKHQESDTSAFFDTLNSLEFSPNETIQSNNTWASNVSISFGKNNQRTSGHAMTIEVEKTGPNRFVITFINTGYGLSAHAKTGKKYHAIQYTLTGEELFQNQARKKAVTNLLQFLTLNTRDTKTFTTDRQVIKEFYRKLDCAFGVINPNTQKFTNKSKSEAAYSPQRGQDCSAKCVSVWAHHKFKEGVLKGQIKPEGYYRFKIGMLKRNKEQLLSERTTLKGVKMHAFFKCFRLMQNHYVRLKKNGNRVQAFFVRLFFMRYVRNPKRLKQEMTQHIDRKITICQDKMRKLQAA